jgi:hypothetical protein
MEAVRYDRRPARVFGGMSDGVFIFAPAEFRLDVGWRIFSCASAGE